MVKVWLFNDDGSDHRLPHQHDPVQLIDLDELKEKTGVLYWKVYLQQTMMIMVMMMMVIHLSSSSLSLQVGC